MTLKKSNGKRVFPSLKKGILFGMMGTLIWMGTPANASEELVIPLTVSNELDFHRESEWVTSGIPFGQSDNILSTDFLNIQNATGTTLHSQFLVTSRWGGGPEDSSKPIRWV